jgi:hypothetical protein
MRTVEHQGKSGDLDLRHVHIETTNLFVGVTKAKAKAFAKAQGCPLSHVSRAANRFMRFWVVGQQNATGSFLLLAKDGGHVVVPTREAWCPGDDQNLWKEARP